MELAIIPHYVKAIELARTGSQGPGKWKLKKEDVVDISSFLNAMVTTSSAEFVDRPSEPIVTAIFGKGQAWNSYSMPASVFRRVMKTQLSPRMVDEE